MRVGLPFAVLSVALLLLLAGPAQAHCHRNETDQLEVPLPQGAPPDLTTLPVLQAMGAAYHVVSPPVGREYSLHTSLDVTMCTFDVCVSMPDFNVAWYDAEGQLIQDDDQLNSFQEGIVPEGTTDGLVYFRTAPYVLTTPQQPNYFGIMFHC